MKRFPPEMFKGEIIVSVDDDPANRDIVETVLSRVGAEVYVAPHGQAGFDFAVEHKPTLIITDLDMPVMNGWRLLEKLKEEQDFKDTPVIALTAHYLFPEEVEKLHSAGFIGYLSKPITPSRFIDNLKEILEKYKESLSK